MDETFSQLIILILIGIGWVIKGIGEARQRKRKQEAERRRQQEELERGPYEEAPDMEPEPEAPLPFPPPPPRVQTEPYRHARASTPPTTSRPTKRRDADLTSVLMPQTITRSQRQIGLRQDALRRLSGGSMPTSVRAATRAGILWSEVLGPPRAVRGPHVPPTFTRGRAPRVR